MKNLISYIKFFLVKGIDTVKVLDQVESTSRIVLDGVYSSFPLESERANFMLRFYPNGMIKIASIYNLKSRGNFYIFFNEIIDKFNSDNSILIGSYSINEYIIKLKFDKYPLTSFPNIDRLELLNENSINLYLTRSNNSHERKFKNFNCVFNLLSNEMCEKINRRHLKSEFDAPQSILQGEHLKIICYEDKNFYLIVPYSENEIDAKLIYQICIAHFQSKPQKVYAVSIYLSKFKSGEYLVAIYGIWDDNEGLNLPWNKMPPNASVFVDNKLSRVRKVEYVRRVEVILESKYFQ
ncbi:MAG: hypothetical protein IPG12_14330 [Saprospiraceae bacterium]|nr:hypothetical protein [Saprospiraceae bacterium]